MVKGKCITHESGARGCIYRVEPESECIYVYICVCIYVKEREREKESVSGLCTLGRRHQYTHCVALLSQRIRPIGSLSILARARDSLRILGALVCVYERGCERLVFRDVLSGRLFTRKLL